METFNGAQSQQKEVVHVCGITSTTLWPRIWTPKSDKSTHVLLFI